MKFVHVHGLRRWRPLNGRTWLLVAVWLQGPKSCLRGA